MQGINAEPLTRRLQKSVAMRGIRWQQKYRLLPRIIHL